MLGKLNRQARLRRGIGKSQNTGKLDPGKICRNFLFPSKMSIMEYNGSAIVAMMGKDCVAIAADRRFGVQALTLGVDFKKIFQINNNIMIGLPGLASDVQTLYEQFRYKVNMYKLNEDREITPKTFAHMVSSTLYEKRLIILIDLVLILLIQLLLG